MQHIWDAQTVDDRLKQRADRLEMLVRETNHRVANSLQLITALIQLQAVTIDHPAARTGLDAIQHRIAAITSVHRLLCSGNDPGLVALDHYVSNLLGALSRAFSTDLAPRVIKLSGEQICVQAEHAIGLGMIINELVTNSCKYAYRCDESGEVRVAYHGDKNGLILEVEDDGCGFGDHQIPRRGGLGSQIIAAMASRLAATFYFESRHHGAKAILVAPGLPWDRPDPILQ